MSATSFREFDLAAGRTSRNPFVSSTPPLRAGLTTSPGQTRYVHPAPPVRTGISTAFFGYRRIATFVFRT
jgi:hypothetical protein